MIGEGRSINVTLIFGLDRYDEVMEAYLRGLEALVAAGREDHLAHVASVASFFVSRVDTEVDHRLESLAGGEGGDPAILGLRGTAAVAQAQIGLSTLPPHLQRRPLGGAPREGRAGAAAAVGVDVDEEPELLGPALRRQPHRAGDRQHDARGHPAPRSRTTGRSSARSTPTPTPPTQALARLNDAGIDMLDVEQTLEDEGVHSFAKSFDELLQMLTDKAATF